MRLGLGAKVFLLATALVSLPTSAVLLYARADIEEKTVEAIKTDLQRRVAVAITSSNAWPKASTSSAEWLLLAQRLSHASGTRVTVIRRDGAVIGDSSVDLAALARVDNHRLRVEVQDALTHGVGVARRHSPTLNRDLLYVAMPYGDRAQPLGVLRMAAELDAVSSEVAKLQRGVGIGSFFALLLSLASAAVTAMWVSRGARQLTAAARRMSEGDLDTVVPDIGHDELGELGRTLRQLAHSLSVTLAELRSERDWMGGILSRMREGVILLDGTQRIKMVNPALREMLLLNDDVVGMPILDAIRHGELKRLLDQVFESGEPASRELEIGGLKPRRMLVRAAPLGRDAAVFAVVFDVTEIRKLESLRKDFVANVSHELRTPVTAIRSAAETLRDVAVNDPKSLFSFVDIVVRNAERLGSIVDDLLELSRIESRELKLVLESIELEPTIVQIVSLFDERARKRGQVLEVEIPESIPTISADRRALELVLTNLVDNALKYSGNQSVIRVSAAPSERGILVHVSDTGPGIPEEHLPRLFERFYRVDPGRSRGQGGTGLGLSIVRHLVESMGSQISVESTIGVGTRFSFLLPLASAKHGNDAAC